MHYPSCHERRLLIGPQLSQLVPLCDICGLKFGQRNRGRNAIDFADTIAGASQVRCLMTVSDELFLKRQEIT